MSYPKPKLGFLFTGLCKSIFKLYCPLAITGKENLPSPPFILCSNHCSHMDTPVLMLSTGLSFSRFGMVAAKDYFFDNKKRNQLLNLFMNLIPINRICTKSSIKDDVGFCKNFIDSGCNLIIYPEGTRSLSGEIQSFKSGVALIASELNLPIVPVHIKGTFQAMPKGRNFPRPSKISASIGKPLSINTLYNASITQIQKPSAIYRQLAALLEQHIRQLGETHHGN
jgi:1-acyl-sn-glycerol-3-phosphate acyltransferase